MRKTERHKKLVVYAVMGIGGICIGILLEQIRTIDKQRLSDYLGQISQEDMQRIEGSMAISLGMKESKPEARNE